MILYELDDEKLPTAEEVKKEAVNSYALILKEEHDKKMRKKKELEALEK
jgi:hypothetical protein